MSSPSVQPVTRFPPSGEMSLFEALRLLSKEQKRIWKYTLASVVIAAIVSLIIPRKYTGETVIYTPRPPQSSLAAMIQLSGIGGSSGGGLAGLDVLSGLGFRNSADLYIGVLQSRTIADSIINRFHLKDEYDVEDFYGARKRLRRNTTIKTGKDTLIHIQVEDRSPQRAAELANAYVEELIRQNSETSLSEASQRRLFFEKQLIVEKEKLAEAEIGLRSTQESTGLIAPAGQAEALLRTGAQLHAEILRRQAQLAGMSAAVSEDNPRLQAVRRELGVLESEMGKLERGTHTPGGSEIPTSLLPRAGLEYVRGYREFKYHESLFEILAKQYEAARLDEAHVASSVQIVDRALPPERKSWPPRVVLTLSGGAFAALCTIVYLLARASWRQRIAAM